MAQDDDGTQREGKVVVKITLTIHIKTTECETDNWNRTGNREIK